MFPQTQFLDASFHQPRLIVGVINGEIAAVTQVVNVPPQHADTKRMERGHMRAAAEIVPARAQQLGYALLHLCGGLVGEGHGQDALRRNPFNLNEMGNPIGDDAGLAAACPGQNKQRPLGLFHRGALLFIELVEQILHAGL